MVKFYAQHRRKAFSERLWTPADITTALWLDSADSATLFDATTGGSLPADDGEIARWEDKSGNARHVTQSTSGSRPLRKTAIINSLDVVRFDGIQDHLFNSTESLPLRTQTWLCVFKENSVKSNAGILSIRPATGDDFSTKNGKAITTGNRTGNRFYIYADGFTYIVEQTGSNGTLIPTSLYAERTNGSTNVRLYVNGTLTNTDSAIAALDVNSSGGFALGARYMAAGITGIYANVDIAEMIVVPDVMSDTDFDLATAYLKTKWGIS